MNINLILLLLYILCIEGMKQKEANFLKISEEPDSATASAKSQSLASEHFIGTVSEANVVALSGHTAQSLGQGTARYNDEELTSTAVAVANPEDSKAEQMDAYQSKILFDDEDEEKGLNFTYQSQAKWDSKDDVEEAHHEAELELKETFKDVSFGTKLQKEKVSIEMGTDVLASELEYVRERDIIIEVDISKEKIIIERILTKEDKVVIISAAKYLLTNLILQDKEYLMKLYNEKCSCQKIKHFLIDLLTEGV